MYYFGAILYGLMYFMLRYIVLAECNPYRFVGEGFASNVTLSHVDTSGTTLHVIDFLHKSEPVALSASKRLLWRPFEWNPLPRCVSLPGSLIFIFSVVVHCSHRNLLVSGFFKYRRTND